MTVQEAITRMRSSVHDVAMEFSDAELLRFLNMGIADVAARAIAANGTDFVHTVQVADGDALPEGFVRTAGLFPVRIETGHVYLLDGTTSLSLRCFCIPPPVAISDEHLPLRREETQEMAVRTAVLLVLNEHEFDITQDVSILGTLVQDAAAAEQSQ